MKNFGVFGLITVSLIVTGLIQLNPVIVGMSIPFLLYILSGIITQPGKVDLIIHRELSHSRVLPGAIVEISVSVINQGRSLELVLFEDILPSNLSVIDGSTRHLLRMDEGGRTSWKYSIQGNRGFYKFSEINIEFRDRFGILPKKIKFPTTGELFILPEMLNVDRLSIHPRKTRIYSGEIPARMGGQGVEFFGVREFQSGDPPNWINWRASARHGSILYSNEFEQERVADVGIILDGRAKSNLTTGRDSIFNHSVSAAATLTNTFINQGNRVSFLHYGQYLHWIYPGYGKYQREKILRALSEVNPGHSMVFAYLENLPTQIFPPKSQIILISTLLNDDTSVLLQLRARGYSLLVIRPNPLLYEKSTLIETKSQNMAEKILSLERVLQHKKLNQGGIRVLDWDLTIPIDQILGSLRKSHSYIRSAKII